MKLLLLFIVVVVQLPVCGQSAAPLIWWNPAGTTGILPGGRGWVQDSSHFYSRLPPDAGKAVRKEVFTLAKESAGMTLHFTSDAPAIVVEYAVGEQLQFPHMPATGVSGIDLYDSLGQRVTATYQFGDTVRYRFSGLGRPEGTISMAYTLYLPLYNTVSWLRVGVEQGHVLTPRQKPHSAMIVVYGTSIAQGACASRPGLAWTNLLSRISGYEVINLGFSGNGRLEPEVIDYLDQLDPDFFILDCLPNVADRSPDEVRQKIINAVEQMRRAHPATPIILAEHAGFGNESTNELNRTRCSNVNAALGKALADLHTRRVKGLYVLEKKAIGLDGDCFVDQVHPNDAGMMRYARAYERVIRRIARHRSPIAGASRSSAPGISPP